MVCDLGSGAGLPGIVLAIARPDLPFLLVEVRRNRADLLDRACADLPNVTVYPRRLETYREGATTCLAQGVRAAGSAPGRPPIGSSNGPAP